MAEMDPHQLALQGMAADAMEAARLESLLESNPADIETRTKLLGHYWQRSFLDAADARRRHATHALWLIGHHPESTVSGTPFCAIHDIIDKGGYRKAKALWDKQIRQHANNTAVLSNAARFHTSGNPRTAIGLLKRLHRMEPRNPDWHERLGHMYHLQSGTKPGQSRNKAAAARALREWESAYALLPSDRERFYLLDDMAAVAVDAGHLPKAVRYASSLLRYSTKYRDWNQGNAVHHAHSALGRVALRKKRVATAKRHLLASARMKGSPQLNSFGPTFDLARELLASGEAKTVVRYLELCRKFWSMGEKNLDAWIKSIRESGRTDFFPVFDGMPADPSRRRKTTRRK
jgi:tetratricopeptide (TPR) repeat protein